MSRLSKVEQARRDGMDYAYRLMKEQGIEALEKRVDRNRKTFAPAFVNESSLHEFEDYVKHNCIITFMCITAMLMRDKYGFGNKRMAEFSLSFHNLADSIDRDYLTYNDILKTIKDETGVDLIQFKDQGKTILDETEKRLQENHS